VVPITISDDKMYLENVMIFCRWLKILTHRIDARFFAICCSMFVYY